MRQSPTAYLQRSGRSFAIGSWRRLSTFEAIHLVFSKRRWAIDGSTARRSWTTEGRNAIRYQAMLRLPAQAKLLGDLVAGEAMFIGERFLQACSQGFAELQSEIRVSEQFPEPIVDYSAHEFLE